MKQRCTNNTVDDRLKLQQRTIRRLSDVINSGTKVLWLCTLCDHTWDATPDNVLGKRRSGCPACAGNRRVTNEDVDNACSGTKLIRLDDVVSNNIPIRFRCVECEHVWSARPAKVMYQNTGCPKCANRVPLTNADVDKRCEGMGVLRLGDCRGVHTKLKWSCVKCGGVWEAKPSNVLTGHTSCPHCRTPQYSKKAIAWLYEVARTSNTHIQHAGNGAEYVIPGTRYKCDGFCETTNTVYEFYGDMWHGNPAVYDSDEFCSPFHRETAGELYAKTMAREQLIREMGYNVVSIWEREFDEARNT